MVRAPGGVEYVIGRSSERRIALAENNRAQNLGDRSSHGSGYQCLVAAADSGRATHALHCDVREDK
jgi:hypothetical protein